MHRLNSFDKFITLSLTNVILHTFCVILLIKTYKSTKQKAQHLHLLNLSMAELIKNILYLAQYFLGLYSTKWAKYLVACIAETAAYTTYMVAMFLLTADRLAATTLNIKYKAIFTIRRTKIVCISTWIFTFCVVLPITVLFYVMSGKDRILASGYIIFGLIPLTLNIVYLLFAITSYVFMFTIFVRSRRSTCSTEEGTVQRSLLYWFRHSKFYVSVILVTSFLLFSVIPYILTSYTEILSYTVDDLGDWHVLVFAAFLSSYLSDTTDAIIYFVMYPPIRRLLFDRTHKVRKTIKSWFSRQDQPDVCFCQDRFIETLIIHTSCDSSRSEIGF